MTISFQGGSYDQTADDRLWLLRAVQFEGRESADVARALVNGFALARAHGYTRPLETYVRGYAQPVNPEWFQSGALFQKALARAKPSTRPAMLAGARRREYVCSVCNEFSPGVVQAVDGALSQGWASDVTDYAAPGLDATGKGMQRRSDVTPGRNTLWTRHPGWAGYVADAQNAIASFVKGPDAGPAAGGVAVVVLLVVLAVLLRGRA